jgi:hypothetical protein
MTVRRSTSDASSGVLTFIANKLSNSATAFSEAIFGVNVTERRIMPLLAIEHGIPASRICQVIGFDRGPLGRTVTVMQGAVSRDRSDPHDGRTHSMSSTEKEAHNT